MSMGSDAIIAIIKSSQKDFSIDDTSNEIAMLMSYEIMIEVRESFATKIEDIEFVGKLRIEKHFLLKSF